jgi:hypothetical protein
MGDCCGNTEGRRASGIGSFLRQRHGATKCKWIFVRPAGLHSHLEHNPVDRDSLARMPSIRGLSPNARRLRASIGAGLSVATVFSIVFVIRMAAGSSPDPVGISPFGAVTMYYACGLAGGTLTGALLPLTGTSAGAALVGALVGATILVMAGFSVTPVGEWLTTAAWFGGFGALGGAYAGLIGRSMWGRDSRR